MILNDWIVSYLVVSVDHNVLFLVRLVNVKRSSRVWIFHYPLQNVVGVFRERHDWWFESTLRISSWFHILTRHFPRKPINSIFCKIMSSWSFLGICSLPLIWALVLHHVQNSLIRRNLFIHFYNSSRNWLSCLRKSLFWWKHFLLHFSIFIKIDLCIVLST